MNIFILLAKIFWTILEAFVLKFVPVKRKSVRGEVVLVTGAAHGVGRCLALEFGRLGATVVLWDINRDGNETTAEQIREEGGTARAYQCDCSKREEIQRVAQQVKEEVGDVTILFNNAGVMTTGSVLDLIDDQIERTFQVNVLAHFWMQSKRCTDMYNDIVREMDRIVEALPETKAFVLNFVPVKRKSVRGEVVLVTGAAHGVGRCLALEFGRLGATVVLWDINRDGNETTAEQIREEGGTARAYQCDCSKREEIQRVAQQVKEEVGDVTILFNNAGVMTTGSVLDLTDDQIERTFQVNVLAHFWVRVNIE
uniref:Uncharacterized protein n=1 Tax=Branchiostoma floridae TaxID=7739 RepID=C3Y100_BRAFL|eukprot:XP_002610123.1 hypothetical protein BRAFLDRAFT_89829 [Branchiostoma floridae]